MKVPSLAWWPVMFLTGGGLCDGALLWVAATGAPPAQLAIAAAAIAFVTATVLSALHATFRSRVERAARADFVEVLRSLGAGWFLSSDAKTLVQIGYRGWGPLRQAYVMMLGVADLASIQRQGSGVFVGETFAVLASDARVAHTAGRAHSYAKPDEVSELVGHLRAVRRPQSWFAA